MKTKLFLLAFFVTVVSISNPVAQPHTVRELTFDKTDDLQHWDSPNHLKGVTVKYGFLRAESSGQDPFLSASGFEFATTPSQVVEFRYRTNRSGSGELYFTNTTQSPYGGFLPSKKVDWNVRGDQCWHTARVFPDWNGEKKIIKLRIDFPDLSAGEIDDVFYEIDWIRVADLKFASAPTVKPDWDFTTHPTVWQALSPGKIVPNAEGWNVYHEMRTEPMTFDVDEYGTWIAIQMAVGSGSKGTLRFVNEAGQAGSLSFPLKADGLMHWYNIDVLDQPAWRDKIHLIELTPSDDPEAVSRVRRLVVSDAPQGPAAVEVLQVYQTEAINRVGKPFVLAARLRNNGGEPAKRIRVIPMGRTQEIGANAIPQVPFDLDSLETRTVHFAFVSEKPIESEVVLRFECSGLTIPDVACKVRFDEAVKLPKADYVPRPQPVESEYEIGALYFPGWSTRSRWDRIAETHPERKPVLGWYDEANPEVIDWQIKWSLENGIRYYLVDWYWDKGNQHLDHWVRGFYRSRYKSMFRWAMMWANHNPPGSHSEEDQRTVTKFWIENYFNTPEYRTVDGRPVVMIWSPGNMDRDIAEIERKKGNELKKGEGVKRLLDLSQQMAREAGYKGIYFIAMKWPEASTAPDDVQWLADAGFEMTSIYHFMDHGGKAKNPMRFDFQLVVDASLPYWEARRRTGVLPFLPNLSTGWDSRPWHGDKQTVIENRTVSRFRKICEDYKRFAEETGIKSFVLAPTNEWGEGSYIEPNAEYGFGMFETIREVFCEKPEKGWPVNYAPADVGLGPYDLPPVVRETKTSWDFADGPQGWTGFMGVRDFKAEEGTLRFETTTRDPALSTGLYRVSAENYSQVVIRMKVTLDSGEKTSDRAQLFWSTPTSSISEANSLGVPVEIDGRFHDYVFPVKDKRTWRRQITSLRFDPVNREGCIVEIQSIKLK